MYTSLLTSLANPRQSSRQGVAIAVAGDRIKLEQVVKLPIDEVAVIDLEAPVLGGLRGEVPRRGPVVCLVQALPDVPRPQASGRAPDFTLLGPGQLVLENRLQSGVCGQVAGRAEGEPVTNCGLEDRP